MLFCTVELYHISSLRTQQYPMRLTYSIVLNCASIFKGSVAICRRLCFAFDLCKSLDLKFLLDTDGISIPVYAFKT